MTERITTYTGRHIDLRHPSPEDIAIDDIAASLSKLARFNGHTSRPYTVAEHCMLGCDYVRRNAKLAFLLHDASEAYLGDVMGPLKRAGGMEFYRTLELRWTIAIETRFGIRGLAAKAAREVHAVDQRMLMTEMRDLQGRRPVQADEYDPYPMHLPTQAVDCNEVRRSFLGEFIRLRFVTKGLTA